MRHPESYSLTRAEWLELNRALAGASLALILPRPPAAIGKSKERLARVRAAQDIMNEIYQRAEKEDAQ